MQTKLLSKALNANAVFSTGTGIILIAAATPIADMAGIHAWIPVGIGAGLLPFAAFARRTANNPRRETVLAIVAADIAWVIGSITALIVVPAAMTTAGLWALFVIAVVVADFAVLQLVGLHKLGATA